MQKTDKIPPSLKHVASISKLMDNQFSIPGTKFKFGLDPVIGLIPGVGDFSTFIVSGYLILIMARQGASGNVLTRMILNILIDSILGAIPFIGDVFDFAFKANAKNIRLMQQHYNEDKYKGGAWKVVIPVLLIVFIIVACVVYVSYKIFETIIGWIF